MLVFDLSVRRIWSLPAGYESSSPSVRIDGRRVGEFWNCDARMRDGNRHGVCTLQLFKPRICPTPWSETGVVYCAAPGQRLECVRITQPQIIVSQGLQNCAAIGLPDILRSH